MAKHRKHRISKRSAGRWRVRSYKRNGKSVRGYKQKRPVAAAGTYYARKGKARYMASASRRKHK